MGGDSGSSWMAVDASGAARTRCSACTSRARRRAPSTRSPATRRRCSRSSTSAPSRARPTPGRARAALGYEPEFLPGARWSSRHPALPASRGRLRADGVERRRPRLHALLARDERRTPVLPLGGVERRRQRADPAVPHEPEVRHRPRVRPPVPGRRRAVLRATGSTAGTSRAAPISCGARAPRPSRRTPTRSSSRTSPRSSTTSTSRASRACGGSSRTRSSRTSTSTISA